MKNNEKILIALGAGLAVGGLLGVLFAPDKGCETRKDIADAGKKISDNVKKAIRAGKERCETFTEELGKQVSRVGDKMEELV